MCRQNRQHRARRGAGALAVVALVVLAATGATTRPTAPPTRVVALGGLFSLTGDWANEGRAARAAMELAVEDVNQYLAGNAANIRFAAAIEDTRLDPELALAKARALRTRGVQLIIGPQSSAEVARLKPFVDANGLLLVSQSSTAGSLAVAGDNVFRFTPSDSLESVAVSALMWDDGVRAIVPAWRDDPGNAGLEKAVRARFTALGGTVLDGAKYAADTRRDFDATVARLDAQVARAVERHGAEKVAVYASGFDESVSLLARAGADSVLRAVRWYGADAMARNPELLGNPGAAAFAIRVGFANPTFAAEDGARDIWAPLAARMRARANVEPDAFAYAVYDAVWVVARGYIASGATRDIERLKHAFTTAAATHYGATGWTVLNAAGDRKYGDFEFWAVRQDGGTPRWARVAYYETRTGRLIRLPAPVQAAASADAQRR